jgi:hypothetical protein
MNLDDIVAIDMHTHAEVSRDGHPSLPPSLMDGSAAYFGTTGERKPSIADIADIAAYYRERRMAAVVLTVDRDKVLFGSDYPVLTPDRRLKDFDTLDIKPDVRPRILKNNAARLLGLVPGA